ncbi:MAG: hypothetical protein GY899_18920 [Verrucomicrobiaceae bacterium]|nr:hypothetical protein [Verrucomicrobiaceae bacterium]
MKILLLLSLLSCFLLIGCGEKKASGDNAETAQDAGAVEAPSEEVKPSSGGPEPLISDADVERFAKDAIENIGDEDYTGWTKMINEGQLVELVEWKNGKPDGRAMLWYENGKIWGMSLNREGKTVQRQAYYRTGEKQSSMSPADDGLQEMVAWHKNGKKAATALMKDGGPLMKDGAPVSMKFWNDKGEELDMEEGMSLMEQLFE